MCHDACQPMQASSTTTESRDNKLLENEKNGRCSWWGGEMAEGWYTV